MAHRNLSVTITKWIILLSSGLIITEQIPMGAMVGCDDGNLKWAIDMTAEGGYIWNTQCSPLEKADLDWSSFPLHHEYDCEFKRDTLIGGLHACMDEDIKYPDGIVPTHGLHRPVWPVYGEYKYIPPQRWIHSLEHGGIVALYHPCADPDEVERLRQLVTGCLRRHVITPSRRLSAARPMALVSWGCRVLFNRVDDDLRDWIKTYALDAPEDYLAADGRYKHLLKKKANIVSDFLDELLCP